MSKKNIVDTPLEFTDPKQFFGYPPYNKSENFELFFYKSFLKENLRTQLTYIPIQWTNLHIQNNYGDNLSKLVNFIDTNIDASSDYFSVVQYAGGPLVDVKNSLLFSQGGIFDINKKYNNHLPLPLITKNKLKNENHKKVFKASYSGRYTHKIRKKMHKNLIGIGDIKVINLDSMSSDFTDRQFESYRDLISSSYFSLCPRGYGPTSFRLYESISLGSVPIYISDDFFLPFKDRIIWENLAVLIKPKEIKKIPKIIDKLLSGSDYDEMLNYGNECEKKFFNFNFMKNYVYEKVS